MVVYRVWSLASFKLLGASVDVCCFHFVMDLFVIISYFTFSSLTYNLPLRRKPTLLWSGETGVTSISMRTNNQVHGLKGSVLVLWKGYFDLQPAENLLLWTFIVLNKMIIWSVFTVIRLCWRLIGIWGSIKAYLTRGPAWYHHTCNIAITVCTVVPFFTV